MRACVKFARQRRQLIAIAEAVGLVSGETKASMGATAADQATSQPRPDAAATSTAASARGRGCPSPCCSRRRTRASASQLFRYLPIAHARAASARDIGRIWRASFLRSRLDGRPSISYGNVFRTVMDEKRSHSRAGRLGRCATEEQVNREGVHNVAALRR